MSDKKTLDGDGHDVPLVSPICTFCVHLFRELDPPDGVETWHCKAFPGGIPMEIWIGDDEHRESHEGDGGLTFKRIIQDQQK